MTIKTGDEFYIPATHKGYPAHKAIRLPDDPNPAFECERMIVKVYAIVGIVPEQIFPVEPEWFKQRGLEAE